MEKNQNMKNIMIACLAVAMLPLAAVAQDANQMKYQQLIAPVASAATTSAVVNVSAFKGNAAFLVQYAAATEAVTSTVRLVHSATSTGTYSTVTNTAGTACTISQTGPTTSAVQTVSIDLARVHPYVKVIVAQATTNEIPAVSALLIAPMKSE